jgi:hypothetical protein
LIRAAASTQPFGCSIIMSDSFVIPEHRDLTAEERRLLEWLLENSLTDTTAFAPRISQTKVVARCTCGCPTLDLAVGGKMSRTVGPSTILVDAYGHSPEGVPVTSPFMRARANSLNSKSSRWTQPRSLGCQRPKRWKLFESATQPNKSLDASGGSVFRKMIGPAMLE